MRLINVRKIEEDMVLARDIYHDDRILLCEGCNELEKYRKRLLELGINYIYVVDRKSEGIEVNDIIHQKIRRESKRRVKRLMNNISLNRRIGFKKIHKSVNDIIDNIIGDENLLVNIVDIKNHDDYTFSHSVNVAVLSIMIGIFLGYDRARLKKLGIGSMLHDIGKVFIPKEILNKPGRLTEEEYEIMKEHPRLGFDFLKKYKIDICATSRNIVLSHHEKYDGSGYPNKRENEDIHQFSRIVAVADVFDALTSDRVYRKKWPVNEVIEYIKINSGQMFDQRVVRVFLKHIAAYPNGTLLKLSNGHQAIVEEQNRGFPERPVVRVINNNETYQVINLMDKVDIVIEDTLE